MSRSLLLILLGVGGIVMDDASNTLSAQDAYPRVMSPTGRFYGPTQAHYQYERQYGRPWHGAPAQFNPNTGANIQIPAVGWGGYYPYGGYYAGNVPFNGYGYNYGIQQQGFGLPGYGLPRFNGFSVYQNQYGYGPIVQYQVAPLPNLQQLAPVPQFSWQQPDPYQQFSGQQNSGQQFSGQQFPGQQPPVPQPPQPQVAGRNPVPGPVVGAPEPVMQRPHAFMPAEPTTVAQRQRSLHLQGQGDIWFRQHNYLQAYSRYKQAASAAADLAAPRFRMAYALMALQRYELAVPELQRGIQLDPHYPGKGESLEQVYGEENRLAAAALPQKVAAWVKQDMRSPERLFVLGALLMISGDQVRARTLLETAAEFGGPNEFLVAYLRSGQDPPGDAPAVTPSDADRPPVPEAVEKVLKETSDWLPPKPRSRPFVGPPELRDLPPAAPALEEPSGTAPPEDVTPSESPTESPPAVPAPPKKPVPVKPGYAPIPKKGAESEPAPKTAEPATVAPPSVEPASTEGAAEDSGPVIPIPGAGQ